MERWEFFRIGERAAAARRMITALNNGERDWRMRIPARPNDDPNLVIGASIADIPQLVTYINELEQALQPFAKYVEALPDAELRGLHVAVSV